MLVPHSPTANGKLHLWYGLWTLSNFGNLAAGETEEIILGMNLSFKKCSFTTNAGKLRTCVVLHSSPQQLQEQATWWSGVTSLLLTRRVRGKAVGRVVQC